jgi:hypothetical protein
MIPFRVHIAEGGTDEHPDRSPGCSHTSRSPRTCNGIGQPTLFSVGQGATSDWAVPARLGPAAWDMISRIATVSNVASCPRRDAGPYPVASTCRIAARRFAHVATPGPPGDQAATSAHERNMGERRGAGVSGAIQWPAGVHRCRFFVPRREDSHVRPYRPCV